MQARKKKSHKPTLAEEFERGIIPRKEFDKKKTQFSQQKPTLGCMYNVEVFSMFMPKINFFRRYVHVTFRYFQSKTK